MSSQDFIITKKSDQSVTMTIRIDESLQKQYDEIATLSNRSRNEIINLALQYAIANLKFIDNLKDDDKDNK
ncbi:MAG: CopG family transcriptional regulator [Lachnospiraceae bacterium]|nr:CopG family transcriptional regulator [Lachnospiraceae bacterium]